MPTARSDYGIASINGNIYVAGGVKTNVLECYDPIRNTWTRRKDMIGDRQNFALVEWYEKLYAIGYSNNLDQYDSGNDKWTTVRINLKLVRLQLLDKISYFLIFEFQIGQLDVGNGIKQAIVLHNEIYVLMKDGNLGKIKIEIETGCSFMPLCRSFNHNRHLFVH